MSSFLIFWGERIRTSEMAGPKPAALPLGDAPTGYLYIIEYQYILSRIIFHVKRVDFYLPFLYWLIGLEITNLFMHGFYVLICTRPEYV